MTPKVKIVENVFPDSSTGPIYVSLPNLAKIGRCEVAEKSSGIADKKDTRPGHFFAPPHFAHT